MKKKSLLLMLVLVFISTNAFSQNTIYGTISGPTQAGVTIEIYLVNCGTTDPVAELTTDENGNYEYGDLENGRYFVAAIEDDIFNFVPRHSWFDIPQVTIQSYDFTAIITVE